MRHHKMCLFGMKIILGSFFLGNKRLVQEEPDGPPKV